jgi:hypothetical protein
LGVAVKAETVVLAPTKRRRKEHAAWFIMVASFL